MRPGQDVAVRLSMAAWHHLSRYVARPSRRKGAARRPRGAETALPAVGRAGARSRLPAFAASGRTDV